MMVTVNMTNRVLKLTKLLTQQAPFSVGKAEMGVNPFKRKNRAIFPKTMS
jgi:hypothetical protein